MNTEAMMFISGFILLSALLVTIRVLQNLDWAGAIGRFLTKYMNATSWIVLLALTSLVALTVFGAGLTLYNPERMKTYIENVYHSVNKSLRSY